MRVHNSARITKSRMMGVAKRLSSHVLWTTRVLWPPIIISDVYSSMARLESPVGEKEKILALKVVPGRGYLKCNRFLPIRFYLKISETKLVLENICKGCTDMRG